MSACGGEPAVRGDARVADACTTATPEGLSDCVDGARYQADLEFIAAPRLSGSGQWQAVQDLAAERLETLGFSVERHDYGTGVNIIGVRPGSAETERRVLLGAHYDHIDGCAGADDNATGTAAALESARVLAMADYPNTLVVALWDEEERGLLGSEAYAARAESAGHDIIVYYNFEMVGFVDQAPNAQQMPPGFALLFPAADRALEARQRRGDFLAFIADETAGDVVASLERQGERIGLPTISIIVQTSLLDQPLLADLRRSDHAPFWDRGIPAVMMTDTSEFRYASYHCAGGPDVVENLDQDFSTQVIRTTVAAAAQSLGL